MGCLPDGLRKSSVEPEVRPPTRRPSVAELFTSMLGSRAGVGLPEGCEIPAIDERAITITQLKKLFTLASRRCSTEGWVSTDPVASLRWNKKLTAETMTHADVERHLVIPATRDRKCSLVELLATAPQPVQWYVIHARSQPLEATIACLQQHAKDHALSENTAYWISTYALCAHSDSTPRTADLVASTLPMVMGKAKGALLVLDSRGDALSRAWVGWEVALSAAAPGGTERLFDSYVFYEERDEESGNLYALGLTDGIVAADNELSEKVLREEHFPEGPLERALAFDLRSAAASSPEEHAELLMHSAGGEAAAARLNATVAARLAVLRLAHLLCERPALSLPPRNSHDAQPPVRKSRFSRQSRGSTSSARGRDSRGHAEQQGSTDSVLVRALVAIGMSALARIDVICEQRQFGIDDAGTELLLPEELETLSAQHLPANPTAELVRLLQRRGDEARLRAASLRSCRLTERDAEAIAGGLAGNTRLQTLSLPSNRLGSAGVSAIARALAAASQPCGLTELDVSSNSFGVDALNELAAALAQPRCELRTLNLSTIAGARLRSGDFDPLWEALGANGRLRSLNLSGWKFGDEGAQGAARMLKLNGALRTLRLSGNGVFAEGCAALAAVLGANRTLLELDLASNPVADDGAAHFAAALGRKDTVLRELILRSCHVTDVGARKLAAALEANGPLVILDLSYNRCSSAGADELLRAARSNTVLVELNLLENTSVSTSMMRSSLQKPMGERLMSLNFKSLVRRMSNPNLAKR